MRNAFEDDDSSYRLLRCIRAYVELDLLASLEVHTDETIRYGKAMAEKFVKLANVSDLLILKNAVVTNVLGIIRATERGGGTSPKCI